MQLFIKKSLLFLLPIFVVLLLPCFFFYTSGEFVSTGSILNLQLSSTPVLLGKILPFWGTEYSKMDIIKQKRPAVLALGNSRVLQLRETFFKQKNFFNGGGITNLTGLKNTIEQLSDEEKPKIIVVSIEQSYFHPYSENNEIPDIAFQNTGVSRTTYIINAWRTVYANLLNGKYTIRDFLRSYNDQVKRIGLQAMMKNAGIRNDGSYSYGDVFTIDNPKHPDYKFQDTFRRMEKGINLMYQGDVISEHSLALLADFLAYAKQRDIHVVGFLPPYAQDVYDKMKSSGKYGYMLQLQQRLEPIFATYGDTLFDFSDMRAFGADTHEIVDGLHASEKAYERLLVVMAKKDPLLGGFTDIPYLETDMEGRINRAF